MREVPRHRPARRAVTVGDVWASLDAWAPFAHAAEWDNVGLLAGRPEWLVRRVLLTIDLTDAVAHEALRRGANLVVAYHPPIFKPIRGVTPTTPGPTSLLPDLLAARVAIVALHTAVDAAVGGTNDVLLDAFDVVERRPLEAVVNEVGSYKLVVFVPPGEVETLRKALSAAGAGVIGHYAECGFELPGRGTFRGDETTSPTVGRRGVLEHVEETRLEMVVPRARLADVVRALYATHSYEEPAFDLYPVHEVAGRAAVGLGRVGLLRRPTRGPALLTRLARRVDLSGAAVVGNLNRPFRAVTAAAGAFGVEHFRDPAALVLTGEFKHHDALALQRRGVTAIHLGHHASERPVLDTVAAHLRARHRTLKVELARRDRSPFVAARARR